MQLKLLVLAASLLVLCGAHAQLEGPDKMMQSNFELKEDCGSLCTSLNGVDFSSLSKPEVSLQKCIDLAEDNATIFIPSGHYDLSEPLRIERNITAIGDGVVVADAQRACEVLHIEDSNLNLSVRIENINFVNGEGEHGERCKGPPLGELYFR
jgi:hypothetical protein